jgi:hypothetical protein
MPALEDGLGQQRRNHGTGGEKGRSAAPNLRDLALLLGEGVQAELVYALLEARHGDDRMPAMSDAYIRASRFGAG